MLMIEFLEADNGDISVTKFLDGRPEEENFYHEGDDSEYEGDEEDSEEEWEHEDANTIMSNNQEIEKNAKKRGKKKKNGKKSKKPFGGPNEDVVFVEFLETLPE